MRYPLRLEGFEGQTLEVQPSGLVTGPKLLVNGQPPVVGARRGLMVLRRDDSREVVASFRPQVLGLDVPRLYVDGQLINVVPPLPWYIWAWSALPILLVTVGGALGALAGFTGFAVNTKIFRASLPMVAKFALTALVSVLAGVVYLVAATLLYMAMGGQG